jgi:hypothetical protein
MFETDLAPIATISCDLKLAAYKLQALSGADSDTCPATNAAALILCDFSFRVDGFRVAAPGAAKRASFQKEEGPYPGTVVKAIPLDVDDRAG